MFRLTTISLVLFITTAFNLVASFLSWQRRKTQVGFHFALGMFGVTFWTLAAGLDYAAVPIPLKVLFAKLEYTGYNFAFVFFAFFALSYAGYEHWLKDIRLKVFFVIMLVSNILLAWTNDWTGWLWISFTRDAIGENTVIFEHGPGYLWAAVTGYLMILAIIVPLWQASRNGSEVSRRQARLIFFAAFVPVVGNLAYLFEAPQLKGVDWSSISFSISGILFLLALYGTRLLDIVPIARDQLVSSLRDSMVVLDIQNRIIDINQAAASMFGSTIADLIGKNLADVAPLSSSYLEQPPDQEIRTELEIGTEPKRYFDVLYSPLRDDRQNIIGRLIVFHDITDRKKNELRLLQLTQAVEQSPASVLITDQHGNITYVNPQFTGLTGYSQSEVLGKNPNIVQSGLTPDEIYREMWHTIQSGRTWHGEFLNRKKNGDLYWENAVIAPVMDQEGHIFNFIAVKDDITERKRIEDALRSNEERFRHLVMSAPDAVFGVDVDGKIVFANREASKLLRYEAEELLGRDVDLLVPLSLREKHVSHRADYFASPRTRMMGSGLELTARCKDGTEVPVEITLSHSTIETGPLVIAFMRDSTERRLLEAERESMITELKKRNAESESLRETTVIVTSTLDVSDVVQKILGQLKRVIAYDSASVWLYKGTTAHMMGGDGIPDILEDDKHYTLSEADPDFPLWSQNLPYVLYDDIQIDYAAFREPPINYIRGWMAIPLKVRERLIGFISLDSKRTGYFTHADAQLALIYANQVSIAFENARLFSNLQDELYERQELINELDAKNSELERFSYAVSHDLKSPLVTAKWFMDYLKDDIAAGNESRVQTDIQRMSAAMDIMQKRIDGILDIARSGWLSNMDEVIDFNELIAEALELVHGRISKRGITVTVEEKLPKVLGNRLRLLEVIQNLLDNAAKFMGDQTDPRIEVGQRGAEAGNPVFFIKDNGVGISPDQHERIFGIFNKLDPKTEGTGIGLSLVKKIIEIHSGRIWIESEAGLGATFYFTLPRG